MIRFFKKAKWIAIAAITLIVICVLTGIVVSGNIGNSIIWPVSLLGIAVCGTTIYFKANRDCQQPLKEFIITVTSVLKCPPIPYARHVLKYKISIIDRAKGTENIVINNSKTIKLKKSDKANPFEYLEQILESDIVSVERMIRENYPRCRLTKFIAKPGDS